MPTKAEQPRFHHETCKSDVQRAHCSSPTCTWLKCGEHKLTYSTLDASKFYTGGPR